MRGVMADWLVGAVVRDRLLRIARLLLGPGGVDRRLRRVADLRISSCLVRSCEGRREYGWSEYSTTPGLNHTKLTGSCSHLPFFVQFIMCGLIAAHVTYRGINYTETTNCHASSISTALRMCTTFSALAC